MIYKMFKGLKTLVTGVSTLCVIWVANNAMAENIGPFQISQLYISNGNNMHVRVVGGKTTTCSSSPDWAYLGDTDSGANAKISVLLAAYMAKKNVTLITEPVNFYNNGMIFCHIVEVVVKD